MSSRLTTFWEYLKNHKIKIPIIQRDYAQGRRDKSAVRQRFLKSLYDAITPPPRGNNDNKPLKLDFVYGTNVDNAIQPLDGQQRLTTLWLLHWYFAARYNQIGIGTEKEICDEQKNVRNTLKKFSYETRSSSRDFCEKLSKFQPDFAQAASPQRLINQIKNQTWFNSAWIQDPTINGMLRMLSGDDPKSEDDNIEAVFGDLKANSVWQYLTAVPETCPIRFYEFDMGAYRLADDLYIKMNARGEQLTSFENFKADIVKIIRDASDKFDDLRDSATGFAIKADTQWTDIFWKNKSDNSSIDEIYFTFINRFFLGELLPARSDNEKYIIPDEKNPRYIYFTDDYATYQQLDFYKFGDTTDALLLTLQKLYKVLNSFCHYCKNYTEKTNPNDLIPPCTWDPSFRFIPEYQNNNQRTIRDSSGNTLLHVSTINLAQRVVFFAICKFFHEVNDNEEHQTVVTNLQRWMRVIWNLVSIESNDGHPAIRTIDAMRRAIIVINKLASQDIYRFLKDCDITRETWSIAFGKDKDDSLLKSQLREEIDKAKQILAGDPSDLRICTGTQTHAETWETVIKRAENFAFFAGAIRFLFPNENGNPDWKDFDHKWTNVQKYFDNNGVKETYRTNARLLRAFLARLAQNKQIRKDFWFGNGRNFWRNIALLGNDPQIKTVISELLTTTVDNENVIPKNTQVPEWIEDETLISDAISGDGDCYGNWHIHDDWKYSQSLQSTAVLTRYGNRISGTISHPNQIIPLDLKANGELPLRECLLLALNTSQELNSPEKRGKRYFIGWTENINFKYRGHWFRWLGAPKDHECDVYLLEDDAQSDELATGKTADENTVKTDEVAFCCFDVKSDFDVDIFKEELDNLIRRFSDDERAKPNSSETQAAVPPSESGEMTR